MLLVKVSKDPIKALTLKMCAATNRCPERVPLTKQGAGQVSCAWGTPRVSNVHIDAGVGQSVPGAREKLHVELSSRSSALRPACLTSDDVRASTGGSGRQPDPGCRALCEPGSLSTPDHRPVFPNTPGTF